MSTIFFKNPVTNEVRQAPTGFSFTNLIFGCFVPFFRGDYKNTIIQLIIGLCTCGCSMVIFPFIYNKSYIKGLVSKGFEPSDGESKRILDIVNI